MKTSRVLCEILMMYVCDVSPAPVIEATEEALWLGLSHTHTHKHTHTVYKNSMSYHLLRAV